MTFENKSMTRFGLVWFIVFNAIFNNISVISLAVSFIDGGNRSTRRKPPTCRKALTDFITYCCIEYTSPDRDSNSQRDCIGCYIYIYPTYDHDHDGPNNSFGVDQKFRIAISHCQGLPFIIA